MSNESEELAADFFASMGMYPERFTREETLQSKTPDLKVYQGEELFLYTEVKELTFTDEDEDSHADRNRLIRRIRDASRQLEAVNPKGLVPNILLFVNRDPECGPDDLVQLLQGANEDASNEALHHLPPSMRISLEEGRQVIDGYVWLDRMPGRTDNALVIDDQAPNMTGRLLDAFRPFQGPDLRMHLCTRYPEP